MGEETERKPIAQKTKTGLHGAVKAVLLGLVALFLTVLVFEFAVEPFLYGQYSPTPTAKVMFIVKWATGAPLSGGEVLIFPPPPMRYDDILSYIVHLNSSGIGITEAEQWLDGNYSFEVYETNDNSLDLLATTTKEYDFRVYRPLENLVYLSKRYKIPKVVLEEIAISNESATHEEFVGRESIIEAVKARPGYLHLVVEPETVRIISVELSTGAQGLVWVAQYECLGTIVGIAPAEGTKLPEYPIALKVCETFDAHTGQVLGASATRRG